MSKKSGMLFFFLCAVVTFSGLSFAETIVLKSGKTIEGKIINRTNEYTEIDFMGVKLKYFNDQIERIKETKSATISESEADAPVVSIKIKGSHTKSSKKADNIADFITKLDNINGKIDSMTNTQISKIMDPRSEKITNQQYESIKNISKELKEKVAEVENLPPPSGCKTLKEIFLKRCRVRLNSLDELLKGPLKPGDVSKIIEKQNKDIAEISKKYSEERENIIKEQKVKF